MAVAWHGASGVSRGENPASGTWTLPAAPAEGWSGRYVGIFYLYSRHGSYHINDTVGVGIETEVDFGWGGANGGYLFVGWRWLQPGDASFGWTRQTSASDSDTFWGVAVFDIGIGAEGSGSPFEAVPTAPATGTNQPNPPAVTVLSDGAAAWVIGGLNNNSSVTAPAGYTLRGQNSSTSGSDGSMGHASKEGLLAGVEDPGAFTFSTTDGAQEWTAWTGIIAPAAPTIVALEGAGAGSSDADAALGVHRGLAGAAVGDATAGGGLVIARALGGTIAGASDSDAELRVARVLAGVATGASDISGILRLKNSLVGAANGDSDALAVLRRAMALAGLSGGEASATASLSIVEALDELPIIVVELGGGPSIAIGKSVITADVGTPSGLALGVSKTRVEVTQ